MDKKIVLQIKNKLLHADVVSFDIFDTLLVRPYIKPTDLFVHMEKHYQIEGFAEARIRAESDVRKKICPEVTLDDIYNEIDSKYKHFKEKELNWEEMVLRPNPQMVEIWNTAKELGKTIIIASDMYLPAKFMTKILKKNGFEDYYKLYISCDCGAVKRDGTMFDLIIKDMGVPAEKILHIGDNPYSDYKNPCDKGLRAVKTPNIIQEFIHNNRRISKFVDAKGDCLGASILVSVLANHYAENTKTSYWSDLGYQYAGPISYSYITWINKVSEEKKISDLLFVARDGYLLQKVHQKISKIPSHYVYAPRYLGLICQLSYRTDDSDVARAQQQTILEHYAKTDKKFAALVAETDFKKITTLQFLEQNKKLLESLANNNFEKYKKYINSIKTKNNVGIIDTITENFTAQKLLASVLEDKENVYGFYFVTIHRKQIVPDNSWFSFVNSSIYPRPEWIMHWGIMEFLLTSPEYPIEGIDNKGKPVYKQDISKYEAIIRNLYPQISDSGESFVDDVLDVFDGADIYLDYDVIVNWINCFIQYPTNTDIKNMFSIKTATNPNNNSYENLFGQYISPLYALIHPKKALRIAKTSMWKTKTQTFFINLGSPIKLSCRGLKKFHIIFLPKLKKEYVSINIFNFKIAIGANK